MARAFVSLGSNIERERHIAAAVSALAERFGELSLSPVYESEPVGFEGARFFNLVVAFDTRASPRGTAQELKRIEAACGRVRGGRRFGPRTLDADLLLYDDLVLREDGLVLPREEILTEAFVLRPLAEIAPGLRHPVAGRTCGELWAAFEGERGHVWPADFDPLAATAPQAGRARARKPARNGTRPLRP